MNSGSPRSYLYVPADQTEKLQRAVLRGADALIIDLEDSVSASNKEIARKNLSNFLNGIETNSEIWVRVNCDPVSLPQDLLAAVHPKVTGISFPKSESAEQLGKLDAEISKLERESRSSGVQILALIETARGVVSSLEIAQSPRVSMLQLGEQDLRRELRLPSDFSNSPLTFARNTIIYASAMAGINPPLGSVATQFSDLTSLRESTEAIRKQGFFGRTCIHPAQVSIVNEVFSRSEDDLRRARRIIEIMEISKGGATVDDEGTMVDEAHLKWAKSILGEESTGAI